VRQEIERKFLVASDAWRGLAPGTRYRQGYLSTVETRTVRIRVAGDHAYLTIKGATAGIARAEFEYEIPLADAQALLDDLCERPLIEKTRYRIPFAGHVWEVDEFHGDNEGLIVAEVELPTADAPVDLPPWIGAEVSADPRYANANLTRAPYRTWGWRPPMP